MDLGAADRVYVGRPPNRTDVGTVASRWVRRGALRGAAGGRVRTALRGAAGGKRAGSEKEGVQTVGARPPAGREVERLASA